jgi:hypothetical protein
VGCFRLFGDLSRSARREKTQNEDHKTGGAYGESMLHPSIVVWSFVISESLRGPRTLDRSPLVFSGGVRRSGFAVANLLGARGQPRREIAHTGAYSPLPAIKTALPGCLQDGAAEQGS